MFVEVFVVFFFDLGLIYDLIMDQSTADGARTHYRTHMHICCVPQCKHYREDGYTFHQFPKCKILKKQWETALKMGNPASPYMLVCSDHFQITDYIPGIANKAIKQLKKNTIPTKNLPIRLLDKRSTPAEQQIISKRAEQRIPICSDNPLKNTLGPSVFLKPVYFKVGKDNQQITPSQPIPHVNVSAKDPLYIGNVEEPAMVNTETEIKVENELIEVICRTCLTENAVTPLNTPCDEGCTLGDMLEYITGVHINTGLPDTICCSCTNDLQSAIAFRRRAQNADKTLRQQTSTHITSAGDELLPSHNIKSELQQEDNNVNVSEPSSSNIVTTEDLDRNQDNAALMEDNESGASLEPIKKATKRTHRGRRSRRIKKIAKACIQNKDIDINQILSKQLKGCVKIAPKPPIQQMLKLRPIDKNQIPLSELKKIQLIKPIQQTLNPIDKSQIPLVELKKIPLIKLQHNLQQKGPIENIINLSSISAVPSVAQAVVNPCVPGTFGTVQSVMKFNYTPPMKRQKIVLEEPVRNTVKSYQLLSNILESTQVGTQQGKITCPLNGCNWTCATHKQMIHHKYTSHLPEHRMFLCMTCGRKSDSRQKALNHMKVHRLNNDKTMQMYCKIQCEVCGIFLRSEIQLERHIGKFHRGERQYKCADCDRSFYIHNGLVMHRKSQHSQKGGERQIV